MLSFLVILVIVYVCFVMSGILFYVDVNVKKELLVIVFELSKDYEDFWVVVCEFV